MAPKEKTTTATKAKPAHGSYQEMITYGITTLKERNGSSRQGLKKFVKANNPINVPEKQFDSLFNRALKAGVEKGVFEQPKGPSGPVKLSKKSKPAAAKPAAKEGEKAAPKKAAAPKKDATKKATTKKAAPKKEATEKKPAAKKAAAPKKAAPKKTADKKDDKPAALSKTKTGKVTKSTKPAAATKKAPAKKAAPKKEKAPKKETAKAEASA